MKAKMLQRFGMIATLLAGAGVAIASTGPSAPPADALANRVRHEIVTYPYYGVWDNVTFQIADGNVVLTGAVTQPYKKDALGRTVQGIPGVTSVTNRLEVLPLSPMDDRLRIQVARAIYRDPTLYQYALRAQPPIHIIVDNGHVTLEGVVHTTMEKHIAGLRAGSVGLGFGPVTNNLHVEVPAGKNS